MTRVAILQSNYIPWKGYFDLINSVDVFVWYDDVQYTTRDWRNRNRIKTAQGLRWLTVPCGSCRSRLINQVALHDPGWQEVHWNTLSRAYARAPFFADYRDFFEALYLGRRWRSLSEMNRTFITRICREILGIRTSFRDSTEFDLTAAKADRLLELLEQIGADSYLSGPAARDYLDTRLFEERGIAVEWMDYDGYPAYPQLHGPFEHRVTLLDLLFHVGDDAGGYIWGGRETPLCGNGDDDAER